MTAQQMALADRISLISVSSTMKVAADAEKLRSEGVDVVDFGAGEPDFPTPDNIKQAAIRALDQNFTKYTAAGGTAELKKAPDSESSKRSRIFSVIRSASVVPPSPGSTATAGPAFAAALRTVLAWPIRRSRRSRGEGGIRTCKSRGFFRRRCPDAGKTALFAGSRLRRIVQDRRSGAGSGYPPTLDARK